MMSGWLVVCSLYVPLFVPFRVSLPHLALLFPLLPVLWLNLFFHVDNAKAINHGASAN